MGRVFKNITSIILFAAGVAILAHAILPHYNILGIECEDIEKHDAEKVDHADIYCHLLNVIIESKKDNLLSGKGAVKFILYSIGTIFTFNFSIRVVRFIEKIFIEFCFPFYNFSYLRNIPIRGDPFNILIYRYI